MIGCSDKPVFNWNSTCLFIMFHLGGCVQHFPEVPGRQASSLSDLGNRSEASSKPGPLFHL
jgi:hypothetical protein